MHADPYTITLTLIHPHPNHHHHPHRSFLPKADAEESTKLSSLINDAETLLARLPSLTALGRMLDTKAVGVTELQQRIKDLQAALAAATDAGWSGSDCLEIELARYQMTEMAKEIKALQVLNEHSTTLYYTIVRTFYIHFSISA